MKPVKILGISAGVLIIALSLSSFNGMNKLLSGKEYPNTDGQKGFTVLELFTSEGCSSCPPADALLAKIENESSGREIYILAYHVDYWDRQGWKDIFSNPEYSKRQMQYGQWLNVSPVYTPQMIINGRKEFVGSDETAIRRAIIEQQDTKASVSLTVDSHTEREGLRLLYKSVNAKKGSRLIITVVQKHAASKVRTGENAGRTLSHVQIVRALQNEPLNETGNGSSLIFLPADFDSANWEILVLLQNGNTGEMEAAARVSLKK